MIWPPMARPALIAKRDVDDDGAAGTIRARPALGARWSGLIRRSQRDGSPRARRRRHRAVVAVACLGGALAISACSSQGIKLARDSSYRTGAELFLTHCSGCHTLSVVGAEGSATSVQGRLRTQAPNFNFRTEQVACVLYAIRNGGFSGQIMPQNIVVGAGAEAVAKFLAKYSGLEAPKTPTIGSSNTCSG
jgi:hypothetical protein